MLLSSTKFQSKAEEIVKEGLEKPLKLQIVEKRLASSDAAEQVHLDDLKGDEGGMMLYTSGTTSRPVRIPFHLWGQRLISHVTERCSPTHLRHNRAKPIPSQSLELYPGGPPLARPPITPHPRHRERAPHAPFRRFLYRVPLPLQCQRSLGPSRRPLPSPIKGLEKVTNHVPNRRPNNL